MSSGKYVQGIGKTGFELEFRVSEVFRQLGWTVIANKYYVDDHQGTVREIDLIAYRTTKLEDFRVATVVVVSCKKNESDAWVLLAKDLDRRDPNTEWQPLHAWSNQVVLKHMLERSDWRPDYLRFVAEWPCELQEIPSRHLFAFQEMNKATGKPNNDKRIFDSVTSLMKAQAYELTALPQRNRPPSIYQFNLLSVVDSDLVRLDFRTNGDIDEVEIDEETYVARYIIARQQTFARIHIVRFSALLRTLNRYNALHEANAGFFGALQHKFYQEAVRNEDRIEVFWKPFIERLSPTIRWRSGYGDPHEDLAADATMSWSDDDQEVRIHITTSEEEVARLNEHTELRQALSALLKRFYRYEGKSRFDGPDIPF
jgi:hypothetical protein